MGKKGVGLERGNANETMCSGLTQVDGVRCGGRGAGFKGVVGRGDEQM